MSKTQNNTPYYQPQNNEVDLFEHAYNNQLPLLIKGPTGCGKTRLYSAYGNQTR